MNSLLLFASIIIIWTLGALVWELKIKKRSIRIYPLLIIFYSEWFKKLILGLAKRFNRFWRVLGRISDRVFIILLVLASLYFSLNVLFMFIRQVIWLGDIPFGAQYIVVIPAITVPINKIFFMLVIAFLFALLFHEVFHGAVAINEGFQIKNAGVVISVAAFGGFVEIDFEEELSKIYEEVSKTGQITIENKELLRKFRKVVAVGIMANLLLWAGFSITYNTLVSTGVIQEYGVKVVGLDDQGNAIKAGLKINDVIIFMNSTRIRTINDFLDFMSHTRPGDIVRLIIMRDNLTQELLVRVGDRAGRPYIGVSVQQYIKSNVWFISDNTALDIYLFLKLNIMIEMIIVLINALPCFILDGANWLQITSLVRWGRKGIRLAFIINIIFSVILVLNFVAPTIISMLAR